MPSFVTPKKNTAFETYVGLVSQSNTKIMQVSPTLAAGDVKVSIDNGATANLATLPVIGANTRLVKVNLSSGEMNGDNISVTFSDAAGAEWCDLVINIQTSARQIDDLAFPQTTGRGTLVAADGSVSPNWADVKSPTTTLDLSGTTIKTTQKVDVETIKTQTVTAAAGVTFPSSIASPTNLTAGTVTTVTNLTNAPTAGDFTATMKASTLARVTLVDTTTTLTNAPSDVAAIKAKTDKLTFDADNALDANVQKVNDVTLIGDGDAIPWGPQ